MAIRYATDGEIRQIRAKGMTVPRKAVVTVDASPHPYPVEAVSPDTVVATKPVSVSTKRKSVATSKSDALMKFRLPSELRERFAALCEKNEETPSAVLRDLLQQYVDASD